MRHVVDSDLFANKGERKFCGPPGGYKAESETIKPIAVYTLNVDIGNGHRHHVQHCIVYRDILGNQWLGDGRKLDGQYIYGGN